MVEDIIARRLVDDPMLTPAELEHRRRRRLEKLDRGWKPPTQGDEPPGKILADVKLTTLVGGLARIKHSDEQLLAAARYRGLFDRIQIGGAKAIDYTAVRVDTSAGPVDLVLSMGDEARQEYRRAVRALGVTRSLLLERVVCHDASMREVARSIDGEDGGAAQARARMAVLDAVDELVDHFGYGEAHARRQVGLRAYGETLPLTMQGRIVVPIRRISRSRR